MCQIKDMRGVPIEQGDVVSYVKLTSLCIDKVLSVDGSGFDVGGGSDYYHRIAREVSHQVLVLPDDYLEDVKHHTPKCRNCSGGCQ